MSSTIPYYDCHEEISLSLLISFLENPDNSEKEKVCNNFLNHASGFCHKKILKYLLERDVNVNNKGYQGNAPIHRAALVGKVEIIRLLFEHGANLNAKNDYLETPLSLAVSMGNVGAVRYLLDNGALVNECDNCGSGPLHRACYNGYLEIVKMLLDSGADREKRTVCGGIPGDYFLSYVRDENVKIGIRKLLSQEAF